MNHVYHSTANMILKAPKDSINCDDLPATMLADSEPVTIVTFWKPSPQELELLNANGLVGLWVVGTMHPPVAVTVEASK